MQINKYNITPNGKGVYHAYKAGYEFMLDNDADFKYETPYKGPFDITQCWKNGEFTLQYGAT